MKRLKISGVRDPENIAQLSDRLLPLYFGFDFRRSSPRYMGEIDEALLSKIPHKTRKIGVFDDEDPLYMCYLTGKLGLNGVQINGNVPIQTCEILAAEGLEVIKLINSVSDIDKYEGVCNCFLFLEREIFENYVGNRKVIVSCDIYTGQDNVYCVDTADGFEIRDTLKDCDKIENWYKNIV